MALELDERQRAMLAEMGVRVWMPGTEFTPEAVAPASDAVRATSTAGLQRTAVSVATSAVLAPTASPALPLQTPAPALQSGGLDWDDLVQSAASCQACGLCAGRKQSTLCAPVHRGTADWMVVGDPPDEAEDRLGSPFAEQAGLLLDNMLKAVRVSRHGAGAGGAYLTNVVKCRPPMGKLPQSADLAACSTYLRREIALVQPKVILAMGRFAVQALLAEHPEQAVLPLGKQRGTVYRYATSPVVVTYHPQVLLRASPDKAKAWADLCLGVQVLRDSDASLQSAHDVS